MARFGEARGKLLAIGIKRQGRLVNSSILLAFLTRNIQGHDADVRNTGSLACIREADACLLHGDQELRIYIKTAKGTFQNKGQPPTLPPPFVSCFGSVGTL